MEVDARPWMSSGVGDIEACLGVSMSDMEGVCSGGGGGVRTVAGGRFPLGPSPGKVDLPPLWPVDVFGFGWAGLGLGLDTGHGRALTWAPTEESLPEQQAERNRYPRIRVFRFDSASNCREQLDDVTDWRWRRRRAQSGDCLHRRLNGETKLTETATQVC
jgi:hypothetical protein